MINLSSGEEKPGHYAAISLPSLAEEWKQELGKFAAKQHRMESFKERVD